MVFIIMAGERTKFGNLLENVIPAKIDSARTHSKKNVAFRKVDTGSFRNGSKETKIQQGWHDATDGEEATI